MKLVYILGTGAMGSLWGSYFSHESADKASDLVFISRSYQQHHYRYHLSPEDRWIDASCVNQQAVNSKIKRLIITCKAYDAFDAMIDVAGHLDHNCEVILLQNGMGSQQRIAEEFSELSVYACSSTEGAYKADDHHVIHAGKGQNLIGPMSEQAKRNGIPNWLPRYCFDYTEDIQTALWRKLIINCAINPLTAFYECRNGQLIENRHYHEHLQAICAELQNLINTKKLTIGSAYESAHHVCEITANNQSSMLQDKLNGKRSELDYITGYAIDAMKEAGLPCKHQQDLYQALLKQGVKL